MANQMLDYQDRGAVNINFVTPTHVLPQILDAILISSMRGLHIPIVWNSGGYDSLDGLRLLDGIVDIYLPDMKYSDTQAGLRLSAVHEYPLVNQAAVLEMFRQVGHLDVGDDGVASRGLLVRHLVMPGHTDNTLGVLKWIVEHLGPDTYVSLMDQYRPAYRAFSHAEIDHAISPVEYQSVHQQAVALGLNRIDPREPDWTKRG
jgi:putative pyruvate formate lyase activating enzyme